MYNSRIKYLTLLFFSLFFISTTFAQDKFDKYVVGKGETVNQIAQKFKITPLEIYKLNPDAQHGLKPNSVLLIPRTSGKIEAPSNNKSAGQPKTHAVLAKETLFGIENKYNVSDEALKKANPFIEKEGLQKGQILTIPLASSSKTPVTANNVVVYHTVIPKETKYSISKQYNITIEELEKKNPEIIANLPVGYQLVIKGSRPKAVPVADLPKVENSNTIAPKDTNQVQYIDYQVKPKETFYSLSKMTGMTLQDLILLNPALKNGVEEGMILKLPGAATLLPIAKKEFVVLTNKMTNVKKNLVLLLPFNVVRNSNDTVYSNANRLRNDKFLNMTLDFYSGALMAIDSAKQLGIVMDVKIFDSNETKNTSNIASLFRQNNLENVDAVIGPFYQSNVEATSSLFAANNVPVISPLSKETGTPLGNSYQSIVPPAVLKTAMFDFLTAKQGNVIAIIDKKKETIRNYILENQKQILIAPLTETGALNSEGFKSVLVKDKMNYVILETENTAMIKNIIKVMMSTIPSYQVQLVILEPNETLETDEINFNNLMKLHLMYPSSTRENTSPEAALFSQSYRKKNKVNPSSFAIRGFDVTFDTMMRLSQGKTYQETAETMITEQVESKFDYYKQERGEYLNKGAYILYYDTDLTIKEAK